MRRDFDLMRIICLEIEKFDEPPKYDDFKIAGHRAYKIRHHVYLMAHAGLVNAWEVKMMGEAPLGSVPVALTWAGHEWIDNIRDDCVWSAVKEELDSIGGSTSFEVLQHIIIRKLKDRMRDADGKRRQQASNN